jgi:hypothetical protein
MLLAGIQAEFGLDPRLQHSGATVWEWPLLIPAAIFEEAHGGFVTFIFLNFVLFATFVVQFVLRFNCGRFVSG